MTSSCTTHFTIARHYLDVIKVFEGSDWFHAHGLHFACLNVRCLLDYQYVVSPVNDVANVNLKRIAHLFMQRRVDAEQVVCLRLKLRHGVLNLFILLQHPLAFRRSARTR